MRKAEELRSERSCLNKAAPNEPIFVLRGKDPLAAITVRHWATMSEGVHEPEKLAEARALADLMDRWRNPPPELANG